MKTHSIGLFALAFVLPATSPGAILFQDTFDAPGTGSWYRGGVVGTLSNDANRLSWAESGNDGNEVIARQFTPTTLTPGQTLRFTYNYTQTTASPSIIRVGLFNLQNTISADGWNVGVGTNIGGTVEGYGTFIRDNSATGNNARYESGTISEIPNHAPLNAGTNIGTLDTTQYDIVQDGSVTYTVVFEVTLVTAGQMNTLLTLSSGATTHVSIAASTSTIYNGFDTAAIRSTGGVALYDNITVELIPEPSAAMLSVIGLSGLLARRKRVK